MHLYPFQEESVQKFLSIERNQLRSVLNGDDMGLGKTPQTIVLDKRRRERWASDGKHKMTLVVTLTSTVDMWKEHFDMWNPGLRIVTIDPKDRAGFIGKVLRHEGDVFICHWAAVRLMPELRRVGWFHVIADEVQKIKNRESQVTVAFKLIKAAYRSALSGTWADDKIADAWSILNWLYPNVFRSYWSFYRHHVVEKYHDVNAILCGCEHPHQRAYREVAGAANMPELHAQIAPYYVRRRKVDVLPDLPEKLPHTILGVDLLPKQRRAYDDMQRTMLAWIGEHEHEPFPAPVVIAQLIRLQQFANAYGRTETVLKWFEELDLNTGQMIKVQRPVKVLRLTEPSSKLDAIMDIVESTNEPIVVFGQSKQVINMLATRLEGKDIPVGILTGDTPQKDRHHLVEEFQKGRSRVFASTIAAGGAGITLTRSSTCVFIDRTYKPSDNLQAEDRLHRIGQKNAVQIIRLVARGTVERDKDIKVDQKWSWLKEVLGDPK